MAEGGVPPQPPVRRPPRPSPDSPSVTSLIDMDPAPSNSSIQKIPSRPAPPIPGGRALPKPPDPGGRVPPRPPFKPPATSVPRPESKKESSTRTKSEQTKIPSRPASYSAEKTTAKRRPEITIVCARPMSEVGFRDQSKPSVVSQSKPSPEINLRKLPAVPPRTDKTPEDHGADGNHPAPPIKTPQQLPSRVPPSATHPPPPSPRPRVAARNSLSVSDKKVSPSAQKELSSVSSDNTLNVDEHIVPLRPQNLQTITSGAATSDDTTTSVKPQFKKPLRPTIIRPQKKTPVTKESSETKVMAPSAGEKHNEKGDNSNENALDSEKSNMPAAVLRPKPVARERPKSMSIADSIKQFESKTNDQVIVPKIAGDKPPPLTPKPKPNILPKPSKPGIVSPVESSTSPSVSSTQTTSTTLSTMTSSLSSNLTPVVSSSSEAVSSEHITEPVHAPIEDTSKQTTQAAKTTKRPTIIRAPHKPRRSSGDEDDTSIVKDDNKETKSPEVEVRRRVKPSTDDFLVNKNNKAPPLPKKRPVSIAGIPHSFSLPSNDQNEDSLDLNTDDQPKPKPRSNAEDKNGDIVHRPKIIGRPPPPSVTKPSRPADTRPKSLVIDDESQLDIHNKPHEPQRSHPPPRPTSFDQRLAVTKQAASKPPVGRPPPPTPKDRSTLQIESEDTEKKDGQPSPALAPTRPPAVSSVKANSRNKDKPEKQQPPRPASIRRTSLTESSTPPGLPPRPTPGHPLYHYMAAVPHGVAMHDFEGVHDGDLVFKAGDRVLLVSQLDEAWMRGKVDDQEGIFPSEFIQVVIPLPNQSPAIGPGKIAEPIAAWGDDEQTPQKLDTIGQGPRCCARFDFEGEGEDDLQFEEGDYIRLLEKIGDEWASGEINGRRGTFPLVYVEIIEDLPLKNIEESQQITPQISETLLSDHLAGESKAEPSCELPVSTVMYDFECSDQGDLPLKVGDKVKVIGFVNDDWLYGQCQEQRGQFPASFIDSIPSNLPPFQPNMEKISQNSDKEESSLGHESDLPLSGTLYCVAVHAFNGEGDEELSFSEGDRIQILENIGTDWCRGKLHDRCGIFPLNFVKKEEAVSESDKPPVEDKLTALVGIALYDFDTMEPNELALKVGDRVVLSDFVSEASDWRWGELNGRRGMFPAAFVEPES
ncbi:SH3 domain-containing protein 19-like [Argopecten irradians]|uniref:SH3 domain-containing protein 19-like n=1 Tax=Argopecten irradians TaxID=31199 RepID=UPI00371C1CED